MGAKPIVEWDDLYESTSFRTIFRLSRGLARIRFNLLTVPNTGEEELWIQQEPFGTIERSVTQERQVFPTVEQAAAYAQERLDRLVAAGWTQLEPTSADSKD